ncbi:hypothetical protein C7N83_11095 [Neisseria iguanae]|uniref:Uncharacterized protein n=1 Tax=Neisseria iguanae TaxID=90242 RepID=A0A2P7TY14_9NEIS|nr:hypothetical protein C7N83_11095 [Neisseria iguanae]
MGLPVPATRVLTLQNAVSKPTLPFNTQSDARTPLLPSGNKGESLQLYKRPTLLETVLPWRTKYTSKVMPYLFIIPHHSRFGRY